MEKRVIYFDSEVRAAGEDGITEITGTGAVVGKPTDLGWIEEEIAPTAFAEADLSDVCVCFNHDLNIILGRNTAGTAQITIDESGNLKYSANQLDAENPMVKSAVRYVERGEVTKSSFMFEIAEEIWQDSAAYGQGMKRIITKVGKVYETGPVTFPAYEDTDSSARTKAMESRSRFLESQKSEPENEDEKRAYWAHYYELILK